MPAYLIQSVILFSLLLGRATRCDSLQMARNWRYPYVPYLLGMVFSSNCIPLPCLEANKLTDQRLRYINPYLCAYLGTTCKTDRAKTIARQVL
ncbi:hypothetical protein V8F33_007215 [Rhypophila sp. PSN 637]